MALEHGLRFFQILDVEIAHAEGTSLSVVDEFLERTHRLTQRLRSAPVQKIAIQIFEAEPAQRTLAGTQRTLVAGV